MTSLRCQLRPNVHGIITSRPPVIKTGGQVTPYTQRINAFRRLDKLLTEKKPRIAITRKQGGIGDVLMTLPTVKAISKRYGVKVDYGTDFLYLNGALPKVLQHNPYIDTILDWHDINSDDYDIVADLTCPCVAYERPLVPPINRIDLFARHLGIGLEDYNIDYTITEEERSWAQQYLAANNLNRYTLVMVQPSSSTTNRDIPPDVLKKVLYQLVGLDRKIKPLVITHRSDNTQSNWSSLGVHVLNNLDIRYLAALMSLTKLLICPDSAMLHMGAALHHPTVTVFGPTDPRARVNYHPEAVAIWPAKELKNFPRWYEATSQELSLCWARLEIDTVVNTCLAILKDLPLPQSRDLVTFGSRYQQEEILYEVL